MIALLTMVILIMADTETNFTVPTLQTPPFQRNFPARERLLIWMTPRLAEFSNEIEILTSR